MPWPLDCPARGRDHGRGVTATPEELMARLEPTLAEVEQLSLEEVRAAARWCESHIDLDVIVDLVTAEHRAFYNKDYGITLALGCARLKPLLKAAGRTSEEQELIDRFDWAVQATLVADLLKGERRTKVPSQGDLRAPLRDALAFARGLVDDPDRLELGAELAPAWPGSGAELVSVIQTTLEDTSIS